VDALVAGIYGMNFVNMPELGWQYGYVACLALMLALSVGLLWGFRKMRWV